MSKMIKNFLFLSILIFILASCKTYFKSSDAGNFSIFNYSDKEIEFIWITSEGDFYSTEKSISVKKDQMYEVKNLDSGTYDIAIDFKGEYNSFNSKKDKSLCLYIEKGSTTVWHVDSSGNINRN